MPDDPWFEELDPMMKVYLFHHWSEDQADNYELAKQHGYLVGSFFNPQAVKDILNGNQFSSTDEEFDQTFEKYVVSDAQSNEPAPVLHRRRRKLNGG